MPKSLTEQRALVAIVIGLALIPIYSALSGNSYLMSEFTRYMIFAVAAVSLDLILGFGGMVCFGQAMFFGIGAYSAAALSVVLHDHAIVFDATMLWGAAALAGAATAFLVGIVSLRTTGVYFIMITLAFSQLAYFIFVGIRSWGGDDGMRFAVPEKAFGLVPLKDGFSFFYLTLAILILIVLLLRRMTRSHFGLVIQGCRENTRRMQALGFSTVPYQLIWFVISGAVAGLAGGLFSVNEAFISPAMMTWTRSGDLIVMVLIGGTGTLVGPIYGAIVFLFLESFLPVISEHWMLAFGPALIVIILVARRGIVGSLDTWGGKASVPIMESGLAKN